jgi:predicted murein hydrolase (TIGR00659 family)
MLKEMKNIPVDSVFFGAVISLAAYEGGLLLKKKFRLAVLNPLLIGTVCVMAVLSLLKIEYRHYHESAKYISYLLTPATVSLAVPLYRQISLLRQNLKAVAGGIASGVFASLLSVFLLAKLFGLSHEQYVTLLPKSITTAIGLGISEELGGITTITVAVIIVTGILGNVIAEFIYKIFHIEEPVAKGLALGTASHAIGTARAMEMGEIEGAMSSLAIAVAGLVTVFGASVFAKLM